MRGRTRAGGIHPRRQLQARAPPMVHYSRRVGGSPRVVLYSKPGCHLCEDMHALVRRVLQGTGVTVVELDITRDLETFVRFRHEIPVLEIDGREVARHRVTEPALLAALRDAGIR